MCTEHYRWNHDYIRLAWDSGFSFDMHKSKLNFDWSSISIVDIDAVIRDRDIAIVEKHIGTILNYHLDEEQTKILDPTFVKVFKLSQLSIQYLLFCKTYLDDTLIVIKRQQAKCKEENTTLKQRVNELEMEIENLKKDLGEFKNSLNVQLTSIECNFKCSYCLKSFLNEEYLSAHVRRRHETPNLVQLETDKLQLEIKELKERLNTTEKYIQNEQNVPEALPNDGNALSLQTNDKVDSLVVKFEELKQFVENELSTLRNQTQYHNQYEKWFEMVFQRLDNSKRELHDVNLTKGDGNYKIESSTQTHEIYLKESEVMTDQIDDEQNVKSPLPDVDMLKLRKDLIVNTDSHLEQIQGVLEEKLAGGLQQIQSEIAGFWKKMEDDKKVAAENGQTQQFICLPQTLESASESALTEVIKPKPAPRTINLRQHTVKKVENGRGKSVDTGKDLLAGAAKYSSFSSDDGDGDRLKRDVYLDKLKLSRDLKNKTFSSSDNDDEVTLKKENKKKISRNIMKKTPERLVRRRNGRPDIEESIKKPQSPERTSESELSQFEEQNKSSIKHSTSTLGQQSVPSFTHNKNVVHVRKELMVMINSRLKDIGVSPAWNKLPRKSYEKAHEILQHQSNLTAKKYPSYWKIKHRIVKNVREGIKKSRDANESKNHESKKPIETKVSHMSTDSSTNEIIETNETFTKKTKDEIDYFARLPLPEEMNLQRPTSSATPSKKKVIFDLDESTSEAKEKLLSGRDDLMEEAHCLTVVKSSDTTVVKDGNDRNDDEKRIDLTRSRNFKKNFGGSTSSVASSIFENTRPFFNQAEARKKETVPSKDEIISDWDISDILN